MSSSSATLSAAGKPSATMVGTTKADAAKQQATKDTKQHRRSRTGQSLLTAHCAMLPSPARICAHGLAANVLLPGCFTCRLRRKKCDEGKPTCRACKHLGLKCEYKRPMWWSNNEQRRTQKEIIKNIIKRTKLNEKSAQGVTLTSNTPPSLCHSLPTSDTFSDGMGCTRAPSVDSPAFIRLQLQPCLPSRYV